MKYTRDATTYELSSAIEPRLDDAKKGFLSAFVDLLNPITQMHEKPAPEYPTAGAGIGVLFRISFVVQRLAVFRTTHNPEDDLSSGRHVVFQF